MTSLRLLLVRMGDRSCAIPCEHVVEIVPRVRLGSLPDAPAGVLGVCNLRGRVVPALDPRPRIAGTPPAAPYGYLVIMTANGRSVGVAVDEVQDVVAVPRSAVERPAELAGVGGPGVVRIAEELVLVLGPDDVCHVAA